MPSALTLITGATGLVGNNVARALAAEGLPVRVLVRRGFDPRVFADVTVEHAEGDICDAASLARAYSGVGQVIHCAGYVAMGWAHRERYQAVNVEGTRNVAQEARRKAGARMIHVSSCDAIGVCSLEKAADEETPYHAPVPLPYAVTKHEAEQVVMAEVALGLDAVIVNPGFMLGPWDWKPSSGRMLLAVAKGQGMFPPRGHFSVCDVRDVAAGIVAALSRGTTGRRYILAGETLSYHDAWRLFAEVTGGRRPLFQPGPMLLRMAGWCGDLWYGVTGRELDVNSAAIKLARLPKHYTSERASRELGYKTRPVRESAEEAWAWFREYGYAKSSRGAR